MNEWPVISSRFPYVVVRVRVHGQDLEIEALLDTGFDEGILVPSGTIPTTVPVDTQLVWRLGDGSRVRAPGCYASVSIGPARIDAAAITMLGDKPLVGRNLLRHFTVTLDHGQRVIVEP